MKLYSRLLLTTPLVVMTFVYWKFHNPDEKCGGLVDIFVHYVFYFSVIVSFILALVGAFHKTRLLRTRIEPITFSIMVITLLLLEICSLIPGHTKGEKWLYALSNVQSTREITFRKNGNFTIILNNIDFGCAISGSYVMHGDTIILDQDAIDKTEPEIASRYLLKSGKLIPLPDTVNKIIFSIANK